MDILSPIADARRQACFRQLRSQEADRGRTSGGSQKNTSGGIHTQMRQYTGRERVVAACSGQYPDRVPADIMGVNIGHRVLGFTRQQLATDPQKAAAGTIKSWELVQHDVVGVGVLSLPMAQAAGTECGFDEERGLYAKTRVLEEKDNLAGMSIPDPRHDDPLPFSLEVCERVGSALKKEVAVRGTVSLPWTVATQMRGMEQLIYDTADDPDFVHAVMRFCTDYTKALGDAVLEAIGEGNVGLFTTDPAAGCSVISPRLYRRFVQPYHEEVVGYFKAAGTWTTFHICGYLDPIMEDIISTGVDGVSIDEKSSLKKMFEVSRGKAVVIGNVHPLLFADGTQADIEAAVRECLQVAAGESAYILSSGCAIPPGTPLENMRYFIEAASRFGGYGGPAG